MFNIVNILQQIYSLTTLFLHKYRILHDGILKLNFKSFAVHCNLIKDSWFYYCHDLPMESSANRIQFLIIRYLWHYKYSHKF